LAQFFGPDLGRPVTNREEIFELEGVPLKSVDGPVVLAILKAISHVDFNFVLSTVCLHETTVLAAHKILHWRSFAVILERSDATHLRRGLTLNRICLSKHKFIGGACSQIALIPPQETTIGGSRNALGSCLGCCEPKDVIDWVMMALLKPRGLGGLNDAS